MEQLCFNTGESIMAIATAVISGVSIVANFIPAPDKLENKGLKLVSKIVHYIALDIVTAKK